MGIVQNNFDVSRFQAFSKDFLISVKAPNLWVGSGLGIGLGMVTGLGIGLAFGARGGLGFTWYRPNPLKKSFDLAGDSKKKQGRIHGYPRRVRVGRSSAGEGHEGIRDTIRSNYRQVVFSITLNFQLVFTQDGLP